MPLRRGNSQEAIAKNIAQLQRNGVPKHHAMAMAMKASGRTKAIKAVAIVKAAKSNRFKAEEQEGAKAATVIRALSSYGDKFQALAELPSWSQKDLQNLKQYVERIKSIKEEYQDILSPQAKFLISTSVILAKGAASVVVKHNGKAMLGDVKMRLSRVVTNLKQVSV